MNIKDIAKIAGVSASTVSKVINGKDDNITEDTRERILRVVKEYNYKPYEALRAGKQERKFVIGVLVDAESSSSEMLMSILKAARECGYGTIVYASSTPEQEHKHLLLLASHQVDGIIWERLEASVLSPDFAQSELGIPSQRIDYRSKASSENTVADYMLLAKQAAEYLVGAGHQEILCISDLNGAKAQRFEEGFAQCLQRKNLAYTPQMLLRQNQMENIDTMLFKCTAVVCSSTALAMQVYEECMRKNRKVPQYLSIVALREEDEAVSNISTLPIPNAALGDFACRRLIDAIEKRTESTQASVFSAIPVLSDKVSISPPKDPLECKIVVVGSIHMDVLLSVESFACAGETVPAAGRVMMPGGKGVNQAIGAAKLDAQVCLIGKLGKDFDGSRIHEFLYQNGVNTAGISGTSIESTGAAYINIRKDGESQIVIYDGANKHLTVDDIQANEALFEDAKFCLIQTELPEELVLCAAHLAKKHGAKVLLKPAAVKQLSAAVYACVNIFMPNDQEALTLCPQFSSVEDRADYFLQRGPETVIITLGAGGCYVRTAGQGVYFPAAPFEAVDTTGAADAFAAALAVSLSRGTTLPEAVRCATWAAGYSITKPGVPSALIDKTTLEFYMATKAGEGSK